MGTWILGLLLLAGCPKPRLDAQQAQVEALSERVAALEAENAELRARVEALEGELAPWTAVREAMAALGLGDPAALVSRPKAPAEDWEVTERAPNTFEVARPPVDLMAEVRRVRVVPSLVDGVAVGFRLYALRPPSFLSAIGLRNGDVVTHVNGRAVASEEALLSAHAELAKAERYVLSVSRAGAPLEITIDVAR